MKMRAHAVAGVPAMIFAIEALNVEKRYGALQALAGVSLVVVAVSLLLLSGICLRILRSGYKLRQQPWSPRKA